MTGKKLILAIIALLVLLSGAQAAWVGFLDNTWSTGLNNGDVVVSGLSATAGTNATVSFNLTSPGETYQAGGVYNEFTATPLGNNAGDFIQLQFTVALSSGGSATNLDRKLSFGLAGEGGDVLFLSVDSGAVTGTKVSMAWDNDDPAAVGAAVLYRGSAATALAPAFSGTFSSGAGAANDTVYTMALVRQADGSAIYSVSQTKTDNNWSVETSLTQAQADSLSLNKVFIGFAANGGSGAVNLDYAVTDLKLTATEHWVEIDFDDTWSTDLSSPSSTVSSISGTAGTNAAVAFDLNSSGASYAAGGVYNSFPLTQLGLASGNSISLNFTVSLTDTNGAAVNLDRKLSFGLAGVDDRVIAIVDSGIRDGTALFFAESMDDTDTVSTGKLFRTTTDSGSTSLTGSFLAGADESADTTYTLTVTRTADGAELAVAQSKTDNNWTSATQTLSLIQANALSFDKVFIGYAGAGGSEVDLKYAVTDLRVSVSEGWEDEVRIVHSQVKERYLQFLKGTETSFDGSYGSAVASTLNYLVDLKIQQVQAFDFQTNSNVVFSLFPGETGYEEESQIYSDFLQHWLFALAYGYTVNAPGNSYYMDPDIRNLYFQSLEYLHGRGLRAGMTFHGSAALMAQSSAPQPTNGAGNIVNMQLRMGGFCHAALLMEEYADGEVVFYDTRALVASMEMLGTMQDLFKYWEPCYNPPGSDFEHRVQIDALQVYPDVTLVSAMLETNATRQAELLNEAQLVFTDSLKIIPGWAASIKPDFTGFHHSGIMGNSYTATMMPQAAFGAYVLKDTPYIVEPESIENLKQLALTYRLYSQKYAMPFGIRGRFPLSTDEIRKESFATYVLLAAASGLDQAEMRPVFERLRGDGDVNAEFVFYGGRGKNIRGVYLTDLFKELIDQAITPEEDPEGFWFKQYAGLAIHRRTNWMAAVKGYGKYAWDYENSSTENVYGQYLSHGMLTIFTGDTLNSDIESGYNLSAGWDWYRQPGTTAVKFPIPHNPGQLTQRMFNNETFMGGVSCDDQNGVFGMIINDPWFPDGTAMNMNARKSVFFSDDLIVMLGTGISGATSASNRLETTLFQSCHTTNGQAMVKNGSAFSDGQEPISTHESVWLADPFGNGYYIPDADGLTLFQGAQTSYAQNGTTATTGNYSTVWFDHGASPTNASYEAAILVQGSGEIATLAGSPGSYYEVQRMDDTVHQVYFPQADQTGYVFFEAGQTTNALISSVDTPCMVMTEPAASGWKIAVTNPDRGAVDSEQVVTFDWSVEDANAFLPSTIQSVEVSVQGLWLLAGSSTNVSVVRYEADETVLSFSCYDGASLGADWDPTSAQAYLIWADGYGLTGNDAEMLADPDGDSINNLTEYAVGSVPTNSAQAAGSVEAFGTLSSEGLEYIYRRRADYAARDLTYTVERNTNLVSGVWTSAQIITVGAGAIDSGFEAVTNLVPTDETTLFIRLKISTPLYIQTGF